MIRNFQWLGGQSAEDVAALIAEKVTEACEQRWGELLWIFSADG